MTIRRHVRPTTAPSAGTLLRVSLGGIRRDLRGLVRRIAQPDAIEVHGVRVRFQDAWSTRLIRDALYFGRYEADERSVLLETLRPSDRYMELGAGIGYITTIACHRVGDENVSVYEANPVVADVVRLTTQRNGFSPSVINAVMGESDGTADFFVHSEFWTSSLAPAENTERISVRMTSFRSELARVRPSYLMIDIEGREISLLSHEPLPAHVRAICVELHPHATGDEPIQQLLAKLIANGFSLDVVKSGRGIAYLEREAESPSV